MNTDSKSLFSRGEISIQALVVIILMLIGIIIIVIISSGVGDFGGDASSTIMEYLADAIGA